MTARRPYSRHGFHALKARVKVAGLAALDGRTAGAQALLEWRRDLIADLGGDEAISAQQRALVEVVTRTKLFIDHLDAFLIGQRSLVNSRRKAALPLLRERQTLADSLGRLLGQLGLVRRTKPIVDLQSYVREKYGSTAPDAERPSRQPVPLDGQPATGREAAHGSKTPRGPEAEGEP